MVEGIAKEQWWGAGAAAPAGVEKMWAASTETQWRRPFFSLPDCRRPPPENGNQGYMKVVLKIICPAPRLPGQGVAPAPKRSFLLERISDSSDTLGN